MYDTLTRNSRAAARAASHQSRQHRRPQILRLALSPPPRHRRTEHLATKVLSLVSESPLSDSSQCGCALAAAPVARQAHYLLDKLLCVSGRVGVVVLVGAQCVLLREYFL